MEMKRRRIGVAIASLLPTLAEEMMADDDVDSVKLSFLAHSSLAMAPMCGMLTASKGPSAAVDGFVERTVPLYSVDDFKSHFRMSRETFQVVHQTNILSITCAQKLFAFQILSQIFQIFRLVKYVLYLN